MKNILLLFSCLLLTITCLAQNTSLSGIVSADKLPVEFATVVIEQTELGTTTDVNGRYRLENVPVGTWTLSISYVGYQTIQQPLIVVENQGAIDLDINLVPSSFLIDQVVVTGTKTFKRQTESPVIVNVIDQQTLENAQACNLSEGLRFQPGLRVETDCQTCNYTQLRMNGLAGGYSQILINGRPIFSPLTGLYGMEQIPSNMIERIEVVRGGGSALYGSSAIGGTVNVITKIPTKNNFELGYTYQNINRNATDHILSGNATVLAPKGNAGGSVFVNQRDRAAYDHNGDQFSELPALRNNAFGTNLFFQPTPNQKIELSLSSLHEYRYGGALVDGPAHLAQQAEERTHDVLLGSLDYQLNFNEDNSSIIAYFAAQSTDRSHFTGILPDEETEKENYLLNPPYGSSENTTYQFGLQVNHRLTNFLGGSNVLTAGIEYTEDDVLDFIEAYNYKIDQLTQTFGTFLQSDWEITPAINLLTGFRADKHNLVDQVIVSPRVSLLYKLRTATQFRLTWGTGFRAPQAFDSDLHIAFAGGGVSRILLSPDLVEERSNSISGSINYDKISEHYIVGFTLEGFYTHLDNAFYQQPLGADSFGEVFEKRNGAGSTVQGLTLELRANYDQKAQLEAGFTLQQSQFDVAVENIEGLAAKRAFLRTPNEYGYATLSFFPNSRFNTSLNLVYTGAMELVHFAGAPEQENDEYVQANPFTELSFKTSYTFDLTALDSKLEFFGGIKNLTNAYQSDFDTGKNRDSNYVYGPGAPRTFFVGLKVKSF
ncbi:MAG: TonB-dependent receptor [Saprospiraceae bacterium]